MEIRRFLGKKINDIIILEGDEFFHCTKVLRHKIGYEFKAFTGDGYDYLCKINIIKEGFLEAEILSCTINEGENKWKIVLCQALCKEFDFIVQKAVELGVTTIIPFSSLRTNVKVFKKIRTEKIILDAVKQCGRAIVPDITELKRFDEIITFCKSYKNRMFCYENCTSNSMTSQLNWVDRDTMIVIGSEGGFSEEEVNEAKRYGMKIVSLGNRVLKAETAAISALLMVMIKYGEL